MKIPALDYPVNYEALCTHLGLPRIIRTESKYHEVLQICKNLAQLGKRMSPDQLEYREALVYHVAQYEKDRLKLFLPQHVSGAEALRCLMNAHGIKPAKIGRLISKNSSVVSKILHHKRRIQPKEASILAKEFSVNARLFIPSLV